MMHKKGLPAEINMLILFSNCLYEYSLSSIPLHYQQSFFWRNQFPHHHRHHHRFHIHVNQGRFVCSSWELKEVEIRLLDEDRTSR